MKLFIQTGAGTGARYTEATPSQIVTTAIGILHNIGMGEEAIGLIDALVHRALGVPVPAKPEEATHKPRRPRRRRELTPEGGKDTGDDPAQSETFSVPVPVPVPKSFGLL